MPNQYTALPLVERFWKKVDKDGPTPAHCPELGPCWCWTAGRSRFGYGRFQMDGRARYAHVVAYLLTYGEPPAETPFITHLCDGGNIGCVRPSHLKPDTAAGNMRQMVERGRSASGDRHHFRKNPDTRPYGDRNGSRKHPERLRRGDNHPQRTDPSKVLRGERVGHAKLTAIQVLEMRTRYATGGISMPMLAREYGVCYATARSAIKGEHWAHLTAPSPSPDVV